jgi:hypothetical protein
MVPGDSTKALGIYIQTVGEERRGEERGGKEMDRCPLTLPPFKAWHHDV